MMEYEYIRVAKLSEIREHRGKLVVVNGEDLALFQRDGKVYALSNVCAHQHFSKLHEGEIQGLTVTCPMHGWTYDMVSGRAINGNGKVQSFIVHVQGEDVYVGVPRREELFL